MDKAAIAEMLGGGRVRIIDGFDDVPPMTEVEEIDEELVFFFPDGTVWAYADSEGDSKYGRLVPLKVH